MKRILKNRKAPLKSPSEESSNTEMFERKIADLKYLAVGSSAFRHLSREGRWKFVQHLAND